MSDWRTRLREAIKRSGMKHSIVALDAGITPETLSRVLTAEHQRPSLETVAKVAHAVNENVGWVLGEQGFTLSGAEVMKLREVLAFLAVALLGASAPQNVVEAPPNAIPVRLRRGDLPRCFREKGAALAFQIIDDSLGELGVMDGDCLLVKPTPEWHDADGHLVVCEATGSLFAKRLSLKGDGITLLSANRRYAPLQLADRHACRLLGIAIGITGTMGPSRTMPLRTETATHFGGVLNISGGRTR